jgi:phage terminase small subunit
MTAAKKPKNTRPAKTTKLTPMQLNFIAHYLNDPNRNGKAAAVAVGVPEATAASRAWQWLQSQAVKDEIAKENKRNARRNRKTRDDVYDEYCKLAFVQPQEFFNEKGVLDILKMDAGVAAGLVSIEIEEVLSTVNEDIKFRKTKIKWADKKAALDSLCRMQGWNRERIKLEGSKEHPLEVLFRQVSGTALHPVAETVDEGDPEYEEGDSGSAIGHEDHEQGDDD